MNDDKTDRLLDQARHAHDDQVYALTIAVSVLAISLDTPVEVASMDDEEYAKWTMEMQEARRLAKLYADPLRNMSVGDVIEVLNAGLAEGVPA